jgi:hypothetical protein
MPNDAYKYWCCGALARDLRLPGREHGDLHRLQLLRGALPLHHPHAGAAADAGGGRMKQVSCCVFDLETTNLSADFGVILCGVVKPSVGRVKIFRADRLSPTWPRRRSDDSRVVGAIVAELSNYDIWVAHNGRPSASGCCWSTPAASCPATRPPSSRP